MSYALGVRVLICLCRQQNVSDWHKAKLSPVLFKLDELPVFEWVRDHVQHHHALPQEETLYGAFPTLKGIPTPEPASYYVQTLENAYYYEQINLANLETSKMLKENQDDWEKAVEVFSRTISRITEQRYRLQVMYMNTEGPQIAAKLLFKNLVKEEAHSEFGWPYLDDMGGAGAGDVVSYIGRPMQGKSFMLLYGALHNWRKKRHNVLFASMEMNHQIIAERAMSMVAGTSLTQLKQGTFATPTKEKFKAEMLGLKAASDSGEIGNMYVVNGNLAADVEDIYSLANQYECDDVFIDGAYLCRHKNPRLDRFTRAAENCELMKRYSEDMEIPTFSSWQFNREASKKQKNGKGADTAGLEDIGYSDAIGQISSIVVGLFQEEGAESITKKILRVLKGRGGETGQFEVKWDFDSTCFDQVQEEDQMSDDNI